jgi:hypothetical protein
MGPRAFRSACQSVCPHVTTAEPFYETLYWGLLLKFDDTFQFRLKSASNKGHYMKTYAGLRSLHMAAKRVLQTHVVGRNTHFVSNTLVP